MSGLIRLENRSVIEIGGEDAHDFLQGILTNDIEGANEGRAIYAGLLTPQGKLLFDFLIVRHNHTYLVDVEASQVDDLLKRLMFYKLRAKVDLNALPQAVICVSIEGSAETNCDAISYMDPRYEKMSSRIMMLKGEDESCVPNAEQWLTHRLNHGLPEAPADFEHGSCFPHDIAMDQLNGIGFKKGCYVGQEVVSRMQHRGTARKRPMIVKAQGDLSDVPSDIKANGAIIGRLGSAFGQQGLAQIHLDRAVKARNAGKQFDVNGTQVELLSPAWASYGEAFTKAE
ncbi:MAG: folate-binding protein YgfZ [bacterium]|nr:folate-binding protein YgfZ [bacterium]